MSARLPVWIVIALGLASASCLLAGLMTPLVAIVVTIGAAVLTLSGVLPLMEIAVLSVAIALLGPGAFSLDARMFGRREILLSNPPRAPKS